MQFRGERDIERHSLEDRHQPARFFDEVRAYGKPSRPEALVRIANIVAVRGDDRRGHKPFPHPFPARMPVEVAAAAIEALTEPGQMVLDPMCGSGVVAKAAVAAGRHGRAVDIDPLAVVQSRALCAAVSHADFDHTAERVLALAQKLKAERSFIAERRKALDDEDRKFVKYWFPKRHADQLFALGGALDDVAGADLWPVFATLFSSLIISRGSGASMAMDLSRSRPHRVDDKIPRPPFEMWHEQVGKFRKYYETWRPVLSAQITVGDARNLAIASGTVDAVVTSPPYLNAIDYMRTSKFSLIFLGGRLKELRDIRSRSIGTEVGLALGCLPPALEAMVENGVADPKRRPMIRRFIEDLRSALAESYRVLKPGGRALFVMGPSILSRRNYDAAEVLSKLAKHAGFTPAGYGRRNISELRRSLPPPRRGARGQSLNKRMTCEFYIALSKPRP